ncbi:aspartate/methionine/tyrosine aminotransferase [Shimia isoporae]|uniref:aspartate transaminase n=1 Tax=Shimia isoporae TaxID=647720 RepID=A0A4R1NMT4_9RHOB|nr:aminotransferase [Shimia isoporae]TCL09644.1 aspartate/methionine/tyrosine aminotransferase [Shimia isoporae]
MTLSRTQATFAPPVMEARRWLESATFTEEKPLINVSQAAPVDPPPAPLRAEIARVAQDVPEAHLYGPVLGLPELRAEVATQWSAAYGGGIAPSQVAITSGCNQAFCATLSAIAGEGDEIILPTPWYFNHKMWLDMQGISTVALTTGESLLPDPGDAADLITDRTRAIVLVTPNNPGGVEYPAELVRAFFELARDKGVKLIVDETYRDFDIRTEAPHDLFSDPEWGDTLIQLYSFSKAYRLTGHRVGAMVADEKFLAEAEKFLDTVTICPNQLGQHAALWGMRNLSQWLSGERAEILDRRAAIADNMETLTAQGWKLMGAGAYFAYMEHPFQMRSDALAKALVQDHHVLCLPGSMFMPDDDPNGARQLRIAFANVDRGEIAVLFERLAQADYPKRA